MLELELVLVAVVLVDVPLRMREMPRQYYRANGAVMHRAIIELLLSHSSCSQCFMTVRSVLAARISIGALQHSVLFDSNAPKPAAKQARTAVARNFLHTTASSDHHPQILQ